MLILIDLISQKVDVALVTLYYLAMIHDLPTKTIASQCIEFICVMLYCLLRQWFLHCLLSLSFIVM